MCIFMLPKAHEIKWFAIDQELGVNHFHSPNAHGQSIHVLHTGT